MSFNVTPVSPDIAKQIAKFKKRVDREAAELAGAAGAEQKDGVARIFRTPNAQFWYAKFEGAADGFYAGQTHIVEIKLIYGAEPDMYVYPNSPPKCTFLTRIWHPNISEHGIVCLDVLKDRWLPAMRVLNAMTALDQLLADPNPDSPQNKKAATEWLDDKARFASNVATFYATGVGEAPADVVALFQ